MFVKEERNRPVSVTRNFSSGASSPSYARQRRVNPRRRVAFAEIEFADGVHGAVLDISEGGLAVQAVARLTKKSLSRVRFRLPDSERWIEAAGKLTWVSPSRKLAGIRFLELSEEARAQIREWVEAAGAVTDKNAAAVQPFFVMRPVTIDVGAAEPPYFGAAGWNRTGGETSSKERKPLKSLVALALLAIVAAGAFFTIGRERLVLWLNQAQVEAEGLTKLPPAPTLRGIPPPAPALDVLPTVKAPQDAQQVAVAAENQPDRPPVQLTMKQPAQLPSVQQPLERPAEEVADPAVPSDFILQVAAMRNKQYAEALADALREKNFPALISPAGAFYVVSVGPFHDADSVGSVKKLLADENLPAVVHRVPAQ